MMATYITTIENCSAPMVVKCTLYIIQHSVIATRGLVQQDICYACNIIVISQHEVVAIELYTWALVLIHEIVHHKCLKRVTVEAKTFANIIMYWSHPFSHTFFKKEMYSRRGMVTVHFLPQSQLLGKWGKFIYKALTLDNKQLLSNMIDYKATQVP